MAEVRTHTTTIELGEPAPQEVAVGSDFVVRLKLTCAEGCDLRALPVCVVAADAKVSSSDSPGGDAEEGIREVVLKAPSQVGEHVWTIAVGTDEIAGVIHAGEPLPIRATTKPHATSLAVWDIPTPVVIGTLFEIKVGAKSSGDCELSGRAIEVCDQSGATLAEAKLGDTPWPGTTGLYWTAVELQPPADEGLSTWSVQFAATELELPHEGASANFNVTAARPPEHRLTVKVVTKETSEPIDEAYIRIGAYRAMTDPSGLALVELPRGTYELTVWKAGFEVPDQPVQVDADLSLKIEAVTLPEEDPDAIWQM